MEDNLNLEVSFTREEIKSVIWDSDGNKSPGLDKFNFKFLKRNWHTLEVDQGSFFNEFILNSKLSKSKNPQSLNDYRPISLVGCLYKIIAKILASRVKKVIGTIISNNQSTFIVGRQIYD